MEKIPRGTGLDPVNKLGFQLAKENFEYLETMHTSAGFGLLEQMGHIDFYPNGGSIQPCTCANPCPDIDCESDWKMKNDHNRAPAYFEESILSSENFLAWKCKDLNLSPDDPHRSCPFEPFESEIVPMGEWTTADGFPEGIFYLTTEGQSPFSCHGDDCFVP